MERPSDEMLMAFADQALGAEETAEVAAYLARDADAQLFVDRMKQTAQLVRSACGGPDATAVAADMAARILGGQVAAPRTSQASTSRATRARLGTWSAIGVAMAASVAVVFGLAAGRYAMDAGSSEISVGPVDPSDRLARILEVTPSGTVVQPSDQWGQRLEIEVTSTFLSRTGAPCREFEASQDGEQKGHRLVAIGCRTSGGDWQVMGAAYFGDAAGPTGSAGSYRPSGNKEHDPLDSVLLRLGAEASLSADEERDLIRRNWK